MAYTLRMTQPYYIGYPVPQGSGFSAYNFGYPFLVQGPTPPTAGTYKPGVPYEYQPDYKAPGTDDQYPLGWDPTYGAPVLPQYPYTQNKAPHTYMPQDPFNTTAYDQETEFGWGEGLFPDPILDYSGGGSRSRFPIADPDPYTQRRNMAAIKRTDLTNPFATVDPYVPGNPDRFGANPPLVRKRGRVKPSHYTPPRPPRMQREW